MSQTFVRATCCLLLAAALGVRARITVSDIERDSREWIVLNRPFGCGNLCHVEFTLDNVQVHWSHQALSSGLAGAQYDRLGFYLAHTGTDELSEDAGWEEHGGPCGVGSTSTVSWLAGFNDTHIQDMLQGNTSRPFAYVSDDGDLKKGVNMLVFINCDEHAAVTFNVRVDMHNYDAQGRPSYLSRGEMALPTMYLVMCLLFGVGLGLWCYALAVRRTHVQKIHWLMTVLGLFKVLTLLAQCAMYHYIRVVGSPDGWNVAYYVFTLFRGTFFFAVVVLIGTGWSYMTPCLGDSERRVLLLVVPLQVRYTPALGTMRARQVLTNVAIIVMDEFTPAKAAWFTWRNLMHVLDIICCAAILFPIVWRIKHLREAASTDGKAARSMKQLIMFRQFYVMVVVYIYFTRIVVYLMQSSLPYEYVWWSVAAGEMATLAFYTLTAIQFRPHQSSQYSKLLTDSDVELTAI